MNQIIVNILKGAGMGAANVIPGVSGGTIALITGIFERLINAIKSFGTQSLRLLFSGKWKAFLKYTDLVFLLQIFGGVLIAIVTLAKLFEFLFNNYPVYIWAFFFGLVMASVYFVGKTITKWNVSVWVWLIAGTLIAVSITQINPAVENRDFIYLILCGIVAICSMILPGLSGSFVLILMGNYQLVAIEAINNRDMQILLPVIIGMVVGILGFSHLLSWVFKRFKNQTIALLTGFILGSLSILWPWQKAVFLLDQYGEKILKNNEAVIVRYQQYFPEEINQEFFLATVFVFLGIVSIWLIEKMAVNFSK
jgi:putative membrane protein